jgi:hypothetical protein
MVELARSGSFEYLKENLAGIGPGRPFGKKG